MNKQTQESRQFFQDQWCLYEIAMENNYIFHKEMYAALAKFFQAEYGDRPFKLLDLGCGDASFMAKTLADTHIQEYMGIDSAGQALELAKKNLQSLECQKSFIEADFFEQIDVIDEKFDVIFISYSLHHLPTAAEKQLFLQKCRKSLKPHGYFVVIDIIRHEDETQPIWYKRFQEHVMRTQAEYSASQRQQVLTHVEEHDFPESIPTYQEISKQAGYSKFSLQHEEMDFFAFFLFKN